MSIIYRHDGISSMVLEMKIAAGAIVEGVKDVKGASDGIAGRDDWKGSKAQAVKDYMTYEHGAIITCIGLLMQDIYNQTMLYQRGYKKLDGNDHAVISEEELDDLKSRLDRMAPVFDALGTEAERIVRSVAHIGKIPYAGLQGLPETIEKLADQLETLNTDVGLHETDSLKRLETEREMISALKAMIAEARGCNLETFSTKALAQSKNYQKLIVVHGKLSEAVAADAGHVEEAEALFQETYKVLEKEYQERVEKAKRAKFWTGLTTAVGSAIIIGITGGAGTVLVGAAAGAINAAVGSYYDQQIGTVGYPGTVNGWEVAGAALFGAAVGAATSAVGLKIGTLSSGLKTSAATTLLGKADVVLQKAALNGAKEVFNGMITRAGDAAFDSIRAGEPALTVFKNVLESTSGDQILSDLTGGFVGGLASQGFEALTDRFIGSKLFPGETVSQDRYELAGQVIKSPPLSTGEKIYNIFETAGKDTAKGIGKRFGSTAYSSGGDFDAALTDAFDPEKIHQDFVYSFAATAGSAVGHEINMDIQQRKLDKINEAIAEETRKYNERNIEDCEAAGIERDKVDGHPGFSSISEVEIEQTYVDPEDVLKENPDVQDPVKAAEARARYQDGEAASKAAIAKGDLDPNVYKTQGTSVTNIETGEKYTWDHERYDVNTGKTPMKLVPTAEHDGIKHAGAESQINSAYQNHDAAKVLNKYNNTGRSQQVSAVKGGMTSGGKITSDAEPTRKNAWASPSFANYTDFQFLAVGG